MGAPTTWRGSAHPSLDKPTPADNEDFFEPDQLRALREYVAPIRRARRIRIGLSSVIDLWLVFGLDIGPRITGWVDGQGWFVQLTVVVVLYGLISEVLEVPFTWWRDMVYEKRAGHSTTTPGTFWKDQLLGFVLNLTIVLVLFGTMYWAIHTFEQWWLIASVIVVAFLLVMRFVAPVLIMPRFNKFTPLEPGPIRDRIEEIARLSGVTIQGAFLMDASKRTTRANAGVTGFGKTKRVIVNDTICEYPLEELSQVIAHELGHYRLNHIVKEFPFTALSMPIMFGFIHFALGSGTVLGWAGVSELGDPASVAVIALASSIPGAVWTPVERWISRKFEREADLEALELLGDPTSFVGVWPRMVAHDKANLEPTWWERVNSTHPEIAERMQFALDWAAMNDVPVTRPPKLDVPEPAAAGG